MNCEFCRMRGYSKPGHYKVRVDEIEWQLCYDCMTEERIKGTGKIVEPSYVLWNTSMRIYKKMKKKSSLPSNKSQCEDVGASCVPVKREP